MLFYTLFTSLTIAIVHTSNVLEVCKCRLVYKSRDCSVMAYNYLVQLHCTTWYWEDLVYVMSSSGSGLDLHCTQLQIWMMLAQSYKIYLQMVKVRVKVGKDDRMLLGWWNIYHSWRWSGRKNVTCWSCKDGITDNSEKCLLSFFLAPCFQMSSKHKFWNINYAEAGAKLMVAASYYSDRILLNYYWIYVNIGLTLNIPSIWCILGMFCIMTRN